MIGMAAPWVFGVAVAAALVTTALHLLSVRRPPSFLLPTMRFLPERAVRAVSRTTRPSDVLLLTCRVAAMLLAGLALAGLTWQSGTSQGGRVVIVDRGRTIGDTTAWRRAVGNVLADDANDVTVTRVILADSSALLLDESVARALRVDTLTVHDARLSLTGALLVAMRAATTISREFSRVDSVELVVVSPLGRESIDEAVAPVRAEWPGRIRLVSVPARRADTKQRARVVMSGATGDDPVVAAFASAGLVDVKSATSTVLVVRDSSGAPAAPAEVVVHWPVQGVPAGWTHTPVDTIGGIVVRGRVLTAPFVRSARAPDVLPPGARAIAWWSDGRAAVVEVPLRDNVGPRARCDRFVGVRVPDAGDPLVGEGARPLLSALSAPCGGDRDTVLANDGWRTAFGGSGSLAKASVFRAGVAHASPLTPWLLATALLLLALEWWGRERES